MLAMGGEGDIIDRLIEMNILPLAISYEYDPCDYLKAQEFQLKRDIPDYKKTQEDDLKNMQTGLFGPKGRVHFQVASCINEELEKLDRSLSKPELFSQISALIDRRIHANYRMYPGNYIAHDYLSGTQAFAGHYTTEEKKHFTDYIDQQLARIELPNKDIPFLREKMLLMYANPLTNYLATRTDNPLQWLSRYMNWRRQEKRLLLQEILQDGDCAFQVKQPDKFSFRYVQQLISIMQGNLLQNKIYRK